ncbi:cyanoexosortase A [Oscillatoria salina]|uniref:cyanoexosortase A n=1 Tax=Oscillatoria salina TaxID=331517 RepID=UPI0013B873D2|nr:cyanoexosortase A [Oscillatoria salina]MBZ8180045.1 cyanoexosortase A [Oscillatoria salina IIICB1]NET88905.1 cyanoexosortase A [Kamptonema sp. SIO1D9]
MKINSIIWLKELQNSQLYLGGLAVALAVLHLILSWKVVSDIDRAIVSVLFWAAILSLLWRKRDKLNLDSDIFSSFLGSIILVLMLVKSLNLFWFESSFLKIIPLFLSLSLGLLASGFRGLKQYWREFILVLLLCLPDLYLESKINENFPLSLLTAQNASFLLWYLGFDVVRNGVKLILPNGAVEVFHPCTGTASMILLLKLTIVFLLVFPTKKLPKILLVLAGLGIGFFSGVIRVGIMALVVSNEQAFAYWHGHQGASIFSTISIVLFGLVCQYLLQQNSRNNAKAREVEQL